MYYVHCVIIVREAERISRRSPIDPLPGPFARQKLERNLNSTKREKEREMGSRGLRGEQEGKRKKVKEKREVEKKKRTAGKEKCKYFSLLFFFFLFYEQKRNCQRKSITIKGEIYIYNVKSC